MYRISHHTINAGVPVSERHRSTHEELYGEVTIPVQWVAVTDPEQKVMMGLLAVVLKDSSKLYSNNRY